MTACIGLGKAWLSFWSGKYGIVWLKSLVMIVSHWKDGRLLLEYVADTPLGKFPGTVSRSLPLIPSSGVCTRSIVFSSLILRRALIEYLLLDKCEPWSCPAESRTVSEECLSVTWWTSSLCFSLRMVSSWSPSCSASNRAATRDCGLWRIGTRIPPGRSFRDLLRGTYVGGVLGALVILRMASASTKAVSCCVDRITGTIPATTTCTSHCQNPRTSEMLQQTCSSLVRSPCDWDVESC